MADDTSNDVVTATPTQENRGPVQTLRHRGAFIKLWQQESDQGPFVTASIGKSYQDKGTGEWKDGYSLSENDMSKIDFLMPEARKEMAQWHDHYREQGLRKDPEPQAAQRQSQAAETQTRSQPAQSTAPDMAAARDQAMGQAAPPTPAQTPSHEHQR